MDECETEEHEKEISHATDGGAAGIEFTVAGAAHEPEEKDEGSGGGKTIEGVANRILTAEFEIPAGGDEKEGSAEGNDQMPIDQDAAIFLGFAAVFIGGEDEHGLGDERRVNDAEGEE